MGYKHYIFNLQKQVRKGTLTDEEVAARVAAKKERATKNLAQEAIYLQAINANRLEREQSYEYRKLVKAGERESYRQRKFRLRQEYLRKNKLRNQ